MFVMNGPAKKRIRLIHWKEVKAAERIAVLEDAGYAVDYCAVTPAMLKQLRSEPPDAFVIDLTRAPSQGRDIGVMLCKFSETRSVPLVFVGGEAEKVARVKKLLPDAVYSNWERIGPGLETALAHPPADPVVHDSVFAAYSGTPLAKKLGIKAESLVTLIGAPEGFEKTIEGLPGGVVFRRSMSTDPGLIVWFVKSQKKLERKIAEMSGQVRKEGMWITWPKKASGIPSDLTQVIVRKTGLANGLVDYKICAVDQTWSALKFSRR